jgi:hypothetical protein
MLSGYGLVSERGPLDIDGDEILFAPHRAVIRMPEERLVIGVFFGIALDVVTGSRPSGRLGLTEPGIAARLVTVGDWPRTGKERDSCGKERSHRCCRITDMVFSGRPRERPAKAPKSLATSYHVT